MVVAVDGPSGAGKSTIAKAVAEALNFWYLDTGALYRAIGYYVLSKGVDPSSCEEVSLLVQNVPVEIDFLDGSQHVLVEGKDVTAYLREPAVTKAASAVAAIPAVREALLHIQRQTGEKHSILVDGRDIGTVVFPDATVKIFLTASPKERARRRVLQQKENGINEDYAIVLRDIKARDDQDTHREIAPLKQAEDAFLVDTTGKTLEQSVEIVINLVRRVAKL